jgi:imidazole glycerol-phosphate synthase subunit HisF
MLCYRVIPLVLLDGYSVLKTIEFDVRRNLGNPITIARIYNARKVDELILLDIDASKEERSIDLQTVTKVAEECFMPLTVGGGIRDCSDISSVLKAGADKVSINSGFLKNPDFIKEAVSVFGSQCIVISLDIKKSQQNEFKIFSHAGINKYQISLHEALERIEECKVGEVLLNNVDLDGKMTGYDLEIIKIVSSRINIPTIVAGGAGKPEDFADVIKAGASAASGASIFHFTSFTPNDCKESMAKAGIEVRKV